jgi:ribonuclease P protein component
MTATDAQTLGKKERISSRTLIEKLFSGGGSRSMSAFPLRLVYMQVERNEGEPAAAMLISVPKRYFKRAVKRNRVKRQVREAYRKNKHILIPSEGRQLLLAFIYTDNQLRDSVEVEDRVKNLLHRVNEKF